MRNNILPVKKREFVSLLFFTLCSSVLVFVKRLNLQKKSERNKKRYITAMTGIKWQIDAKSHY